MKSKHQIKRLREQLAKLEAAHAGNEQNFTYHGGRSLGYLQGQLAAIEDFELSPIGKVLQQAADKWSDGEIDDFLASILEDGLF